MGTHAQSIQQRPNPRQQQVAGRWLRHDVKVTWQIVVCSLIVVTFAAIGAYTACSALTSWWLGR